MTALREKVIVLTQGVMAAIKEVLHIPPYNSLGP